MRFLQTFKHRPRTAIQAERLSRKDIPTSLLEGVVSLALKSRLKRCLNIDVDVDSDGLTLLSGRVRSAKVTGKGWESPQNLTARKLEFGVGEAALDYAALISKRNIVLRNTPTGMAQVSFSASDFGNFLVHPLMTAAASQASQGDQFLFEKDRVQLHLQPQPHVTFFGSSLAGQGPRYSIRLGPSDSSQKQGNADSRWRTTKRLVSGISITAVQLNEKVDTDSEQSSTDVALEPSQEVSEELTNFFNNLLIDLQGVELRFYSLTVTATSEPLIDLILSVKMRAFPPLNLSF